MQLIIVMSVETTRYYMPSGLLLGFHYQAIVFECMYSKVFDVIWVSRTRLILS